MKFHILQSCPASHHFLPLRSKCPPQHPVLKQPQSVLCTVAHRCVPVKFKYYILTLCMFSPTVGDQISHLFKTRGRITVFCILSSAYVDKARQDESFLTA